MNETKDFNKITSGYVVQTYKTLPNGTTVCQWQEFVAGGDVDYEDLEGNYITIDTDKEVYCPFHMVQPKYVPTDDVVKNVTKEAYENGVCPDCGDYIPDDVQDGDNCNNCGHVFYDPTVNNDDITDPNS